MGRLNGRLLFASILIGTAPLTGLLGTVTGMIAVFDAMATQGGNARSMAAGVSMATIPTMSGMIASLSGLVGTTYLKRKVEYETQLFEDKLTLYHKVEGIGEYSCARRCGAFQEARKKQIST